MHWSCLGIDGYYLWLAASLVFMVKSLSWWANTFHWMQANLWMKEVWMIVTIPTPPITGYLVSIHIVSLFNFYLFIWTSCSVTCYWRCTREQHAFFQSLVWVQTGKPEIIFVPESCGRGIPCSVAHFKKWLGCSWHHWLTWPHGHVVILGQCHWAYMTICGQ